MCGIKWRLMPLSPGAVLVPLDEWDVAAKAVDTGFAKTAYGTTR
jgi:hypothetical protein